MVAQVEPGPERDADELQREAIGVLRRFLQLKEPNPSAMGQAKIAASTFSSVTRLRQTRNAENALNYQMARDIAGDKEQLQRYIAITQPGSPFAAEALSAPKA